MSIGALRTGCLPVEGRALANEIDLQALIAYLREELELIDRSILALERMAESGSDAAKEAGSRTEESSSARAGVNRKKSSGHRTRTARPGSRPE